MVNASAIYETLAIVLVPLKVPHMFIIGISFEGRLLQGHLGAWHLQRRA
jgi:hypothetical protein